MSNPMAEQQCPVCKSDSYLNPNIKIFISPCFHKICEQCLYKIFAHGSAPCPECGTQLRRINFISSTFEDVEVEREIRIRKVLLSAFNRTEDQFDNPEEYNDYLECFENTVFELLDLKNDALVKGRIEYLKENNNILNSRDLNLTDKTFTLPETKKLKLEKDITFRFEIPKESFVYKNDIQIPESFMAPSDAGGLSRNVILAFISSSLEVLKIHKDIE